MKTAILMSFVFAAALPGQKIVTTDGKKALSLTTESATWYSIRQSDVLMGIAERTVATSFAGTGEESAALLPTDADRHFYHITTEPLTAVDSSRMETLLTDQTVLGFSFLPNQRFSWFGEDGNWTYQINSAHTGILTLNWGTTTGSFDVLTLDFGISGDLSSVDFLYSGQQFGTPYPTDSGTIDLTQNSFAPNHTLLNQLLTSKEILNYLLFDDSRFVWNSEETGNYNQTYIDDDKIKIVFTYDEDNNDPSVYREEVTFTFTGNATVPVYYELYEFNSLSVSQSVGNVTLSR